MKKVIRLSMFGLLLINSPLFSAEHQNGPDVDDLPELGMGNTPIPQESPTAAEMAVANTAQTVGGVNWNSLTGEQIKNQAENWIKSRAKEKVLSPVQQQAQDMLGKFGRASVGLSIDDRGDLSKSSFSLFTPWYENDALLVFSQTGVHDQDGRTIGNFGAGLRWEQKTWLLGYNTFLDRDFSRYHSRLGIGVELWTDSLRLASNYYYPLSAWKDSKDFDDSLERPAKGFDIRAQGYLPSYPHLGASLAYERYYGKEVALFGKENLQANPYAIMLGLDYTPVPLATLKVSHKEGQQGQKETLTELQINYRMGTSLEKQLDPDNVNALRTLRGSRYDNVDRNYDIVLEYKEKSGLLEVDLAAVPETLLEGDTWIMQPLVKNKYRITGVSWNGDIVPLSLLATAGTQNPQGWQITLPAWRTEPDSNNRYRLSIILEDETGRQVTSNPVDILVGHQRQGRLLLESAASLPASGLSDGIAKLSAHLSDHQGLAINDASITPVWHVADAATGATVPVVVGAGSCPTDTLDVPQPCITVLREESEIRSDTTHYVQELASTQEGTFVVRADLGIYGMSNPQTLTFTTVTSSGQVVRAEIQDPAGRDLLTTGDHPQVGVTYSLKLFDAVDRDITATLTPDSVRWLLDGTNTAGCAITLNAQDTGVRGYQFTPRVNAASNSGVACGDQGFALRVEY